jgi:hypothetical protein
MAGNTVSDIIIKVTADASQAIQGLNQVKTTVTNTVNETANGFKNFRNNSSAAAKGTEADFAAAGAGLGMFERQAGIHFQAAGNQVTGFGGRITVFGKQLQGNLKSAGASVTKFGANIKQKLGTEAGLAFAAAGAAALSFSKQCIDAAVQSEAAWSRYGGLVNSAGGNWQQQSKEVKQWARDVSNSYGYAVSDTREASATLMQAGNSFDFVKNNMQSVAALAARTGTTQTEAAQMITSALNGKAMALRKATGLEIENYRAADGSIDKQRLMNDILNQNTDALKAHGETTEAMIARLQNSWGALKTSLGQALLPVLQMIVPAIQWVVDAFNKLPGPVKPVISVILLIGGVVGVVLGALAMLAPAIMAFGTMISAIASAGGVIAALGGMVTTLSAAFPLLAGAVSFFVSTLLPIIAVVAAVVAAFILLYEVGKKLGWWNDLGGMFKKFGETLSWVGGQIMGFLEWCGRLFTDFPAAMQQLQDFLGSIDIMGIIRALFDASPLGAIMNAFGVKLSDALFGLGEWVYNGLQSALSDIPGTIGRIIDATPVGQIANSLGIKLSDALRNVPKLLADSLKGIKDSILGALTGLGDGVDGGGLSSGIMAVIMPIPTMIRKVFSEIWPQARQVLVNTWNNIVQGFQSIGGRIWTALTGIPGRVAAAFERVKQVFQQKLGEIRTKASQLMARIRSTIIDPILGIPAWIAFHLERLKLIFQQKLIALRFKVAQLMARIRKAIIDAIMYIPGWVSVRLERLKLIFQQKLIDIRFKTAQLMARIRDTIRDKIMEAYHKARDWLSKIGPAVSEKLGEAAQRAMEGAKQIYQNIIDKIMEIPKKVEEELNKIPGKIKNALANAASQANLGAASIVASFMSGLSARSPGKIQRFTKWEFESLEGHISRAGHNAQRSSYTAASNIVKAWTDGMPGVLKPNVEFGRVPSVADLQRTMQIQPLISNLQQMHAVPTTTQATTKNSNVTNKDNSRHIHIENITLECGELTQAQSKKVLYNALQGL